MRLIALNGRHVVNPPARLVSHPSLGEVCAGSPVHSGQRMKNRGHSFLRSEGLRSDKTRSVVYFQIAVRLRSDS